MVQNIPHSKTHSTDKCRAAKSKPSFENNGTNKHKPWYNRGNSNMNFDNSRNDKDTSYNKHRFVAIANHDFKGRINRKETIICLDCGSSVSLIGEQLVNELHLTPTTTNTTSTFSLANNNSLTSNPNVTTTVQFSKLLGHSFATEVFVVPSLNSNVILGLDFLRSTKLIIDFSDMSLNLAQQPSDKISTSDSRCEEIVEEQPEDIVFYNCREILPIEPAKQKLCLMEEKQLTEEEAMSHGREATNGGRSYVSWKRSN